MPCWVATKAFVAAQLASRDASVTALQGAKADATLLASCATHAALSASETTLQSALDAVLAELAALQFSGSGGVVNAPVWAGFTTWELVRGSNVASGGSSLCCAGQRRGHAEHHGRLLLHRSGGRGPCGCAAGLAQVPHALEIMARFDPLMWVIENPATGLLKTRPFMERLPWVDVTYCKTRLWANMRCTSMPTLLLSCICILTGSRWLSSSPVITCPRLAALFVHSFCHHCLVFVATRHASARPHSFAFGVPDQVPSSVPDLMWHCLQHDRREPSSLDQDAYSLA